MNRAWNISYGLGCVGHGTKDTTIRKESESPSMVVVVRLLDHHRRCSLKVPSTVIVASFDDVRKHHCGFIYIATVSGVLYDLELLVMEGDASRPARSAMIALLFLLEMGKDKNSGPSVS